MATGHEFYREEGILEDEHYALGHVKIWFRFAKFSCPRCGKRHTMHRGEAHCTCGKPHWTTFEFDGHSFYAHWQDDGDVGPAEEMGQLVYDRRIGE